MGLNVSKSQISKELDLSLSDVHEMTTLLRTTVVERKPEVTFAGEVEFEKVYIVAGHKGHPEALKNLSRPPRQRKLLGMTTKRVFMKCMYTPDSGHTAPMA